MRHPAPYCFAAVEFDELSQRKEGSPDSLHFTMSTIASKAKYPPVKPNCTVDDCIKAFRFSDYLQWGGVTIASWGYGFVVGRPARFAVAGLMAGIGFTFGSLVVLQNTRGRLMGFRENDREIKKFGVAQVPEDSKPEDFVKPKLDFKKFN